MLSRLVEKLAAAHPGAVLAVEDVPEDARLLVAAASIEALARTLKGDPELAFTLLVELTAVDYIGQAERFEVIYQLYSPLLNLRLRLKARVTETEPELATVSGVWRVADPLEREVWDMFGIRFTNHPNLTRLLMYESFEGHPLRKDYPLKKAQPIVELRTPIVVKDDPPYQWTEHEKRAKAGLKNAADTLGRGGMGGRLTHD